VLLAIGAKLGANLEGLPLPEPLDTSFLEELEQIAVYEHERRKIDRARER
jgi:hypothetical protein